MQFSVSKIKKENTVFSNSVRDIKWIILVASHPEIKFKIRKISFNNFYFILFATTYDSNPSNLIPFSHDLRIFISSSFMLKSKISIFSFKCVSFIDFGIGTAPCCNYKNKFAFQYYFIVLRYLFL